MNDPSRVRSSQRRPISALFATFGIVLACAPAIAGEQRKPLPLPADHAEKMSKGMELFKNRVRPLLVERCLRCHQGRKAKAELDLSDRDGLLRGGVSGPAIVPGQSTNSLLYRLVTHAREPHMPAKANKLSSAEIAALASWIDNGAPYDQPLVAAKRKADLWTTTKIPKGARDFWSFRPLQSTVPPVRDRAWCRTSVDHFVLAKLEAAGLKPNGPANRRQLIRRISFDLVGLPPSPVEVDRFLNDQAPDAESRLVDRLLASPHFGERWGRYWLDLARFAESHGFEHDYDRPSAYHYRDFVIRAFDEDLPFDKFVKWQLAGDEYEPENPMALAATGFLAAGVHSTQITKNEVERQRYDELDDMLATTGTAMLGLTIGCARCHDHKFDPIPQRDYYSLLATFTTTVRSEIDAKSGPGASGKTKMLIASEGLKAVRLHTQGDDFFPQTYFLRRGDTEQKEGAAAQAFLQVLTPDGMTLDHWRQPPPSGWRTSYRRRALAEWITDVDHGAGRLLARVIVNRLWQHLLGKGIVATASDFGTRGDAATHPELLDWLASELIRNGWHLKPVIRLIVDSAVYRESADFDETRARVDPEDRWLWRRRTRRLEAEAIRDALLAVSGTLDEQMYGPGTLDEHSRRRSIYFTVKRSKLIPMLQVFDAPDALQSQGERATTTVAPQALLLMNDENVRACARALARRIAPNTNTKLEDALAAGYRITVGRQPSAEEMAESRTFVERQARGYAKCGRELALTDFCQALMCLNEFIYID
jgi:mono/diheme cytochrome c family protein